MVSVMKNSNANDNIIDHFFHITLWLSGTKKSNSVVFCKIYYFGIIS